MTLLAFSLTLVSSQFAAAECVTESEMDEDSTCVVYALNGVRGVWFSLSEADSIRRMRLELPELRSQIQNLEQINRIQEERIQLYIEARNDRQEAMDALQTLLDAAFERETNLRRQLGAWYRAPSLWLSVGLVIASAAYIAIMASVD